jgi:hypothetical protein
MKVEGKFTGEKRSPIALSPLDEELAIVDANDHRLSGWQASIDSARIASVWTRNFRYQAG